MSGCSKKDDLTIVSNECGITLNNATIKYSNDTHGGFHYDGCKQVIILCDSDFDIEEISSNEHWHELPLSDNINKFLYQPYSEQVNIPIIENGYFYFKDRFEDTRITYNDNKLFDRQAFNFTVAIYDSDSNVLYYVKFDSQYLKGRKLYGFNKS